MPTRDHWNKSTDSPECIPRALDRRFRAAPPPTDKDPRRESSPSAWRRETPPSPEPNASERGTRVGMVGGSVPSGTHGMLGRDGGACLVGVCLCVYVCSRCFCLCVHVHVWCLTHMPPSATSSGTHLPKRSICKATSHQRRLTVSVTQRHTKLAPARHKKNTRKSWRQSTNHHCSLEPSTRESDSN